MDINFCNFKHPYTFLEVMWAPTWNLSPISSAVLHLFDSIEQTDRQAKYKYRFQTEHIPNWSNNYSKIRNTEWETWSCLKFKQWNLSKFFTMYSILWFIVMQIQMFETKMRIFKVLNINITKLKVWNCRKVFLISNVLTTLLFLS